MQRLSDIFNRAIADTSTDLTAEFSRVASTAPMNQCKEAISLVKKVIKEKKRWPSQKLVALKLLHAGMMTGNISYLTFASKKISRRFLILARHHKESKSEDRGYDLFGAMTGSEAAAASEFLKCLLAFIKMWARSFGIGPDKNPSDFYKLYNTLYREGVGFPSSASHAPEQRQQQPKPVEAKPETKPEVRQERRPEREAIPAMKSRSSELEACKNTIQVVTDMMRSGDAPLETLTELIRELQTLKQLVETNVQEALNSGNTAAITELIDANDRVQSTLDQFAVYKSRPQSKAHGRGQRVPAEDILGLDDSPPRAGGSEYSEAMFKTYAHNSRQSMPAPPAFDTSRQSQAGPSAFATLPASAKSEPKPSPAASDLDFSSAFSSSVSSSSNKPPQGGFDFVRAR
jgi:hypothetical protein